MKYGTTQELALTGQSRSQWWGGLHGAGQVPVPLGVDISVKGSACVEVGAPSSLCRCKRKVSLGFEVRQP